jgi:hypothetical protein
MFLSVVILGGFTTEAHAMASVHQDRHAANSTTSRDVNADTRRYEWRCFYDRPYRPHYTND